MTGELIYGADTTVATAARVPFPIATRKRSKIAVIQTKQTKEVISNRYKNDALFAALRPDSFRA